MFQEEINFISNLQPEEIKAEGHRVKSGTENKISLTQKGSHASFSITNYIFSKKRNNSKNEHEKNDKNTIFKTTDRYSNALHSSKNELKKPCSIPRVGEKNSPLSSATKNLIKHPSNNSNPSNEAYQKSLKTGTATKQFNNKDEFKTKLQYDDGNN